MHLLIQGPLNLLILGGVSNNYRTNENAEVVKLGPESLDRDDNCFEASINNTPFPMEGSVGRVFNQTLEVCGSKYSKTCSALSKKYQLLFDLLCCIRRLNLQQQLMGNGRKDRDSNWTPHGGRLPQ